MLIDTVLNAKDLSIAAPSLSVVLPVYGNALNLRPLHARLTQVLNACTQHYELIFVDDACPYGSGDVLKALAAADPQMMVITLPRNMGQHCAVIVGLQAARGPWTLIMDADLQDPPEALPLLLAAAIGADQGQPAAADRPVAAVFAGRRGRYESLAKLFTSRVFKMALHLITGAPRDAGMFVLISEALRERLLQMAADRRMAGFPPFVVAMIGCAGLPVRSIPVTRAVRVEGESTYTPALRFRTAARAIRWAIRWKWIHLARNPRLLLKGR